MKKSRKTALITGVTGQDGSYLSEFLLKKGYNVVGIKRRTSLISTDRIDHLLDHENFSMRYGSLHDASWMYHILNEYKPQEIYSQISVKQIFEKLAHSSIMRLNKNSMDKLYDLMTMGLKFQLLSCRAPSQFLQITLNHLGE